MRCGIFILLGIFFLSVVSAAGTETKTSFNVGGCSFKFGDETIGVLHGTCSIGEAKGLFYCEEDGTGWHTTSPGLGCSRGEDTYEIGSGSCCPDGYFCNELESEKFQCERRTEDCIINTVQSECIAVDCTWLEESLTCVDSVADLSCGYYQTGTSCLNDTYNLGRIGVGTDILGTIIECEDQAFSVLAEESACEWNASYPEGEKCHLNYVAGQMYAAEGETRDSFSCSNVYKLGNCTDGKQSVTWTSASTGIEGFEGEVPEECLIALGCDGGESTRFCGEATVKLSGFSLFSIFASLFVIGIFYFSSRK